MKIEQIELQSDGYAECRSPFYRALDVLDERKVYRFAPGIHRLEGEIDSGNWAVSYLLSMYSHRPKDFTLFEKPNLLVNGVPMSLADFSAYSCYMARDFDPLFSTGRPLDKIIAREIRESGRSSSPDEIREQFGMDAERFVRPISGVGNEIFKAMAAIGYLKGRQVFCFPWMSQRRFDAFHAHLTWLLRKLEELGCTVILPIGMAGPAQP